MLNARQAYTSSGQKKRLKNINIENADLKEQNKKLEQENQQLKPKLKASEKARKDGIDLIEKLRFEKWAITGTDIMEVMDILDIDKGE